MPRPPTKTPVPKPSDLTRPLTNGDMDALRFALYDHEQSNLHLVTAGKQLDERLETLIEALGANEDLDTRLKEMTHALENLADKVGELLTQLEVRRGG